MNKILFTLAAATLATNVASAQSTQTLPRGFDVVAGGSLSSFPFNTTADHKWQWHYDSGQFDATGPIVITDVRVRPYASATAVAFDFPSVTLTMASSPTDYTVAGNGVQPGHDPTFDNNLNSDATVVYSGSFTGTTGPLTWLQFGSGMTTNFSYDPTVGDDFILQIEKCGTTTSWGNFIDGTSGTAGLNGGNRYGDTSNCASTVSGFSNNEYVPLIEITYQPAGPSLSLNCGTPGQVTADISGATPTSPIALVYGPSSSYTHAGAQCNGVMLDLTPAAAPLLIFSDANGDASLTVNNGNACGSGLLVQAVDVPSCEATNSATL